MTRWRVYLRERFPLAAHAPLVAAFSVSAVSVSRLLRGERGLPDPAPLAVAFLTALLFFFQLRVADEFKDFEDDSRFRPYRPVPRGLVTLGELGRLGLAAGAVQLALSLWLAPSLVVLLAVAWAYLGLMTREFFVPGWLKARPIAYMASHMAIIPLIDLFATACDWRLAGRLWPPEGLIWFLLVSYANGVVVEIGRKTRALQDEEPGVETYSALWGRPAAAGAWLLAVAATAVCAWITAGQIGIARPVGWLLAVLSAGCALAAVTFLRSDRAGAGRRLEVMSGVWTLLMYLSLGAVPALLLPPSAP
jgi:4-hydroxybenzoate polyprenyltransferase